MKTEFICENCGYVASKWYGRCPQCGEWNCFSERESEVAVSVKTKKSRPNNSATTEKPKSARIKDISFNEKERTGTGIGEFDRVLGGGIVAGSVVLLSGEPGIGKSTLLLQICSQLGNHGKVLYITGEESSAQIKLRCRRLGVDNDNVFILSENNIDSIITEINTIAPEVVIIDSIQTMYDDNYPSSQGSVTQVRQCALRLIGKAKEDGVSMLLVGHVNKEGAIAGPKVLEHMVDAVLYFEGDKQHAYRIVRAEKNRYGSTNEIGVFEMGEEGLTEIEKPSEMLLSQRPKGVPGNCPVCVVEGSRPIIAEVQCLVTPTVYPTPRRMSSGIDYNRTALLLAVLEKRLGMKFSSQDVYVNVAAGMRLIEPACDAACAMAMISTYKNIPIPDDLIVFGEIGLAGECRSVSNTGQRINEAVRLGFKRIALPYHSIKSIKAVEGVNIIPLRGVFDLLKLLDE
ncbi:MAG: DNA repair protein RadA [Clostridia bacterium]|nr:DNA repair protein RadA [Clostridia bacterium]